MDETGEGNKNLWEGFVASVEYMLDRDGLEAYARPFRRAGGGDLLRWMRRADTDDEKKIVIRAVFPREFAQRSA